MIFAKKYLLNIPLQNNQPLFIVMIFKDVIIETSSLEVILLFKFIFFKNNENLIELFFSCKKIGSLGRNK